MTNQRDTSGKIKNTQSEAFKKAARELGCDEDESHFDEKLKKIARHKPPLDQPPKPKSKTTKPGQ